MTMIAYKITIQKLEVNEGKELESGGPVTIGITVFPNSDFNKCLENSLESLKDLILNNVHSNTWEIGL